MNRLSKKLGTTKKEIIEPSLKEHFLRLKKIEFEEGFKKLADDRDIIELSEMGMGDYISQIDDL